MVLHKTIYSHADLQAQLDGSDEEVVVELISLESVSIASESYAILRRLMDLRFCLCPQLNFLSLVACLSAELRRVERDLLPPLQIQEAKLDGASLEALLLLNNSALALIRLAKRVKEIEEGPEEEEEEGLEEHGLSGRAKVVGISLVSTADSVLKGTDNIDWLQARVSFHLKLVNDLLATPVRFR